MDKQKQRSLVIGTAIAIVLGIAIELRWVQASLILWLTSMLVLIGLIGSYISIRANRRQPTKKAYAQIQAQHQPQVHSLHEVIDACFKGFSARIFAPSFC